MVTETMYGEVTAVHRTEKYLNGYGKPATNYVAATIKFGDSRTSLKYAEVVVPADLPLGTRFKMEIEQVDEVTPATIHRGAIPRLEEAIEGTLPAAGTEKEIA